MLAMYQDPRASSKNLSAEQQLELAIDYNLQDQFLRFHKVKTLKPRVRIPRFHESLSDEKGERSDQPDIQQAEQVQVPEQQEQQQELEPEQQQDVAPEDLAPEQHQELEHPHSTESDVSAMSGPPPPPMRQSLFRKKPITMKSLQSQKASYRWHRLQNETFVNYLKRTEKLGKGKSSDDNKDDGLYDDQIDKLMSKFKDFKGCIMKDEIKKLLPDIEPQSRVAFIINTDTSDKPGQHWQPIYIDGRSGPESSNLLEFFDSFGRSIPPDVLEDCKLILKIMKPETILKVKENRRSLITLQIAATSVFAF